MIHDFTFIISKANPEERADPLFPFLSHNILMGKISAKATTRTKQLRHTLFLSWIGDLSNVTISLTSQATLQVATG